VERVGQTSKICPPQGYGTLTSISSFGSGYAGLKSRKSVDVLTLAGLMIVLRAAALHHAPDVTTFEAFEMVALKRSCRIWTLPCAHHGLASENPTCQPLANRIRLWTDKERRCESSGEDVLGLVFNAEAHGRSPAGLKGSVA